MNHEGYSDPTADLAVRRTFRPGKKKKLSFMGIAPVNAGIASGESASASGKQRLMDVMPVNAGIASGESASASGKQRLMEKISSVNAGIASGESATASEVNIPYSNQNGKYTDRRKKGADPDESDV